MAAAMRRQRVDAQPELVAGGLLEQARIHAAPLDRFEHLAPARLGHRHRVAHLPIDVQGETAELLPLAQRERQLPLQHARVGIEELQFHCGFGQASGGMRTHCRRAQLDRTFAGVGVQQRRDQLPLRRGLRPGRDRGE